jgi:hypothetical protein
MAYDSQCYLLAEHFLRDEPNITEAYKDALAQRIQDAVEAWLQFDLAVSQRASQTGDVS